MEIYFDATTSALTICYSSYYAGKVVKLQPDILDADGNITDVTVSYTEGYAEQMLRYSKDYSVE